MLRGKRHEDLLLAPRKRKKSETRGGVFGAVSGGKVRPAAGLELTFESPLCARSDDSLLNHYLFRRTR